MIKKFSVSIEWSSLEYWVGARRLFGRDRLIWVWNDISMKETDMLLWAPGNPTTDGDCLVAGQRNDYKFYNLPCNEQLGYVCETFQ